MFVIFNAPFINLSTRASKKLGHTLSYISMYSVNSWKVCRVYIVVIHWNGVYML